MTGSWSLRSALQTPRESWEMILLYRSLMSRISIDIDPSGPEALQHKSSSRKFVRQAFRDRNVDLLNVCYDRFSETTGTRLVSLAEEAYRGIPEGERGRFTGAHMDMFMFAYRSIKYHETTYRKFDDTMMIHFARPIMRYPERAGDIYIMLVKRGLPTGDITPPSLTL